MSDPLKTCHETKTPGTIVTFKGRAMFCALAERFKKKNSKRPDDKGEYATTIVAPPECDPTLLKQIATAAAKAKWGDSMPSKLKNPVRKCKDVEDDEGKKRYPDAMDEWWQIRANTYSAQPGVIGPDGKNISDLRPGESEDQRSERMRKECYAGRWMRISVSAAPFDTDGNRGVKFWLNNVQLLDHDEKIGGGRAKAEDDFGAPPSAPAAKGTDSDSVFD